MSVIHVNTAAFENTVLKADRPVLVDFWAPWCGPCQMLGPVLDEIAAEHDDFIVAKINVDEEMELAAKFGIASIPTMLVFNNGEIVKRTMGFQPKAAIENLMK